MKTKTYTFKPETEKMNFKNNLKRWKIAATIVGAGLICASIFSAKAAPVGMKTLHGHVPAAVSHLKAVKDLSAETNLTLAIGLPLHNTNELAELLKQVYDPNSPNYHHFLTPEQFTEKFGPTKEDYQMVENFARVNGLDVKGTHANRMLLDVTGKASAIEKAFNVKLHVYQHPKENRQFFAPDSEPSVNASLPILDVSGLDNYRMPHPLLKIKSKNVHSIVTSKATPNAGSGPVGLYMGDDFRNAYVPGTTLNGSAQTVALVQFDGYLASDISEYESLVARTNIPLQNVLIDGFSGAPTGDGGEVEVSLDIEMVLSMAPALSKIVVYEGDPFNFHPNDVLNQIVTDNLARQISCSWGWIGGPTATTDQIFQQMAIQGQTFFTASGDSDAYLPGEVDDPNNFGTPSDSAYLTSVGGTTLAMNGQGVSYSTEVVWNWGTEFGADGIGSSGGISTYYAIPSWQTNINMLARGGDNTKRNFPDVALTADNVFVIADGGAEYSVGGTSCASPLWAGFTALANQQAVINSRGSLGFLNPALYAIANSANYTNCFHDIVVGNNEWSQSPALFVTTNNYDLCTGLGTPNGVNLINALVNSSGNGITHLSPPSPPYGSTLTGLNGQNPNGTWELFVLDDANFNSGIISNGWALQLTTANPVGFSGDLALGMTASAGTISISNTVVFTLAVTNYGPSASSNVFVVDTLPLTGTVIGTSADQGVVTRNGQSLNWNVGNLSTNAGSNGSAMLLTMQLNSPGDTINFALASAGTPDANADDDLASATVTVINPNPPQFSSIIANGDGTFQLTITSPALPTIIEASTNLTTWTPIYTNTPPFTFTDSHAADYPNRFYRAVTP